MRLRKKLAMTDRERADWKRWCQAAEARAEDAEAALAEDARRYADLLDDAQAERDAAKARAVPDGWKVAWPHTCVDENCNMVDEPILVPDGSTDD
jgi:hypothetical protein